MFALSEATALELLERVGHKSKEACIELLYDFKMIKHKECPLDVIKLDAEWNEYAYADVLRIFGENLPASMPEAERYSYIKNMLKEDYRVIEFKVYPYPFPKLLVRENVSEE